VETAMNETKKAAKGAKATGKKYEGFTAEERGAMKDRAEELKAETRGGSKADVESEVLAKIAEMPQPDRGIAERLHAVVKANAPSLAPRLYYGMPAYAKSGKVACFYQPAAKFKTRYGTFNFTDEANLDEGNMWPTSFALAKLTAADEKKLGVLVKKSLA